MMTARQGRGNQGQAILEYLLIAGFVAAAALAMRDAVGWKTLDVAVTSINQVEAIPLH